METLSKRSSPRTETSWGWQKRKDDDDDINICILAGRRLYSLYPCLICDKWISQKLHLHLRQKSDCETPEIQHRCLLKMSITMKNNSAAREYTLANSLQGCMLINGVSNKPSKCLNKSQVKKGIPLKPRNKWPSKVLRHPPGLLVGKKKPLHERQKIIC